MNQICWWRCGASKISRSRSISWTISSIEAGADLAVGPEHAGRPVRAALAHDLRRARLERLADQRDPPVRRHQRARVLLADLGVDRPVARERRDQLAPSRPAASGRRRSRPRRDRCRARPARPAAPRPCPAATRARSACRRASSGRRGRGRCRACAAARATRTPCPSRAGRGRRTARRSPSAPRPSRADSPGSITWVMPRARGLGGRLGRSRKSGTGAFGTGRPRGGGSLTAVPRRRRAGTPPAARPRPRPAPPASGPASHSARSSPKTLTSWWRPPWRCQSRRTPSWRKPSAEQRPRRAHVLRVRVGAQAVQAEDDEREVGDHRLRLAVGPGAPEPPAEPGADDAAPVAARRTPTAP